MASPFKTRWSLLGHPLVQAALVLLAVCIYVQAVVQEVANLRTEVAAGVNARAVLLQKYLSAIGRQGEAMARLVLQNYEGNLQYLPPSSPAFQVKPKAYLNGYGLSGFAVEEGDSNLVGSLSGLGDMHGPGAASPAEWAAALALDANLGALLKDNEDIAWAYYVSAKHFLYFAPKLPLHEFHLVDTDYQRVFWQEAVLPRNPGRRQVVTPLYQDSAGKGLMITLSTPVWRQNQLLGVVGVDVSANLLMRYLVSTDEVPGETLLIDSRDGLVASSSGEVKPEQPSHMVRADLPEGQFARVGDEWQYVETVLPGGLFLTRRMPVLGSYACAMRNTSHVAVLLLSLGLLYVLLLRVLQDNQLAVSLSQRDSLTGLLNRRGLLDSVGRLVRQSRREKQPWFVLMFDIDHFKAVNDRFGHGVGDVVIQTMTRVASERLRPGDYASRWGGEEFVVCFGGRDLEGATRLAERLLADISEQTKLPDGTPVTVSIGLVQARHDESVEQAIARADRCMYQAKQNGRNQVCSELATKGLLQEK